MGTKQRYCPSELCPQPATGREREVWIRPGTMMQSHSPNLYETERWPNNTEAWYDERKSQSIQALCSTITQNRTMWVIGALSLFSFLLLHKEACRKPPDILLWSQALQPRTIHAHLPIFSPRKIWTLTSCSTKFTWKVKRGQLVIWGFHHGYWNSWTVFFAGSRPIPLILLQTAPNPMPSDACFGDLNEVDSQSGLPIKAIDQDHTQSGHWPTDQSSRNETDGG